MNRPEDPSQRPSAGDPKLPPELKGLEAQLATLRPREDRLDRERLMFRAGQASVEAGWRATTLRRWAWPASFSGMTAMAATLLAMLVLAERRNSHTIGPSIGSDSLAAQSPGAAAELDAGNLEQTADELASRVPPFGARMPMAPHGVYTAGMPLPPVERLLSPVASQFVDAAAVGPRNDAAATPMLSSRSLDDVLSETRSTDAPS